MSDFDALIAKLEAWTDHSFHVDRQLSDEILLADGWKCEADSGFAGGVRWFHSTGHGGTFNVGEHNRPHPINDLAEAFGLVPREASIITQNWMGGARASITPPDFSSTFYGESPELTVAICIAAVKALKAKAGAA